MISANLVLGAVVTVGGAILLLFVIPDQVTMRPGELRDPSLFPRISAWLLIGLGVLQMLFQGASFEKPTVSSLTRLVALMVIMVAATVLQKPFGFVPTTAAMIAVIVVMMGERRPFWLAVSILGLPVGIWLLFERVLQNPLP